MFLVIIPILAVVLIGLAAYVHPIFERVFHTYDELNNVVDENLQGIPRGQVVQPPRSMRTASSGGISETIYNNFVRAEKILSFNAPGHEPVHLHGPSSSSPGSARSRSWPPATIRRSA